MINTPWITWIKFASNKKVIELCKESHIGFLPTFQDTYGFSILEMQACGCPVVTTNVRACPEINSNDCGWIIPLKIDDIGGETILNEKKDKIGRETELLAGLENIVTEIFVNPEILEKKALKSMEKILRENSPVKYSERLFEIYNKGENCCDAETA